MKYMKMMLAYPKLNNSGGFDCQAERHAGQGVEAKFLVILADDRPDDRPDEWMFEVKAFWAACEECVTLLEEA